MLCEKPKKEKFVVYVSVPDRSAAGALEEGKKKKQPPQESLRVARTTVKTRRRSEDCCFSNLPPTGERNLKKEGKKV